MKLISVLWVVTKKTNGTSLCKVFSIMKRCHTNRTSLEICFSLVASMKWTSRISSADAHELQNKMDGSILESGNLVSNITSLTKTKE